MSLWTCEHASVGSKHPIRWVSTTLQSLWFNFYFSKSCCLCYCLLVMHFFLSGPLQLICFNFETKQQRHVFKWNKTKKHFICDWALIWQKIGLVLIPFGPAGEWRLACPACPWLTDQILSTSRLLFQCLMKLSERRLNGREGQNNNHYQSPSFCFIR